MHKIFHNYAPDYLCELLPNTIGTCTGFGLRTKDHIRNISCKNSTKFRKSFIPDTIDRWNNLDVDIRSIDDASKFKDKVCTKYVLNKLFCFGSRKINIVHSQMRMQCSKY